VSAALWQMRRLAGNQVIRFLALGGFAAAVNWVVRFPLSAVMPFEAAVFVAYLIGMSVGFTLYRAYVFPGSVRPIQQQVVFFLLVNAGGAVIVLGLSSLFVALSAGLGLPLFVRHGLGHGAAIAIGAIFNFFGHRLLTFTVARR